MRGRLSSKVSEKIIVLGQAAEDRTRIRRRFLVEMVGSLEDAVRLAHGERQRRLCILLAARVMICFVIAHRGEEFKRCVYGLVSIKGEE
jgi:hypothetical protein